MFIIPLILFAAIVFGGAAVNLQAEANAPATAPSPSAAPPPPVQLPKTK